MEPTERHTLAKALLEAERVFLEALEVHTLTRAPATLEALHAARLGLERLERTITAELRENP